MCWEIVQMMSLGLAAIMVITWEYYLIQHKKIIILKVTQHAA